MSQTTQTNSTAANGQAKKPIRVGDRLLERGLITQGQLDQALAEQRDPNNRRLLGQVLVDLEFITEEQVLEVMAEAYGVPFARLTPALTDPAVFEQLPKEFLQEHAVLPLFLVRGKLTVAVHEPENMFLVEEIAQHCGHQVQLVAATKADIHAVLDGQLADENVFVIDELVDDIGDADLSVVEAQVTDLTDVGEGANDSPVIKLVNYVIYSAVQESASDIHIEPGDKTLRVRFRVDGALYEKMQPPYQMHPAIVSRIKIMAGMDISERRLPQDGGITVMMNKAPIDLRVNTMPGKTGEKVVMRIIDNRNVVTNLEKLGFNPDMLQLMRDLIHQPNGIMLVTGPTGSGKSTTLYAALSEINDVEVNICTVENPVEYNLEGINQFQTNEKAGFTFASALRALLRQDPDVVMVGEIRDQETAKIATQAALTGHMVLSTLHTNDAPAAVTRLINIGVEPYLVAASIRGALAQRLIRKLCSHCKEAYEPPPSVRQSIEAMLGEEPPIETYYKGAGCSKCRGTGYAGRAGIYELFAPDDACLEGIANGAGLQEVRKLARACGWKTLREDGLSKLRAGITSVEEVFKVTAAT